MILVFAGTKDGREIINLLLNNGHKVIASTATEYGNNLLNNHPNLKKIHGKLDFKEICTLIKAEKVTSIIDATHPYAVEISQNIIRVSTNLNIKAIRYDRPSVNRPNITKLNSYVEINYYLQQHKGNILLTIGANNLSLITKVIDKTRIIARLLPISSSLKKAENAGLKPSQIIAIQGPCSTELNSSLLQQFNIKYLVTKDSGYEGGLIQKLEAAQQNNVEVIMLSRPQLPYKRVVNVIDDINKML